MSGMILIMAVGARFCRLGRCWDEAGALVEPDAFTEEEWERLRREPRLHVAEATQDDLIRLGHSTDPAAAEQSAEFELRIDEAIRTLAAGDFDSKGVPKMAALRGVLGDDADRLDTGLRDRVFSGMRQAGFAAPSPS